MSIKAKDDRPLEDDYEETPMRVISPSGYGTYKSCERKFWISYGPLNVKEPNTCHTVRGTLVHAVAEDLWDFKFQSAENWKQKLIAEANRLFDEKYEKATSLKSEGPGFKHETRSMVMNHVDQVIKKLGGQFDATPKFGIKGNWTMIKPKVEENYFMKEHGVRGRVDELIPLDDKIFVVKSDFLVSELDEVAISDLKTSKIFKMAFTDEYKDQIHFYGMLHYLKYGVYPTHGCIKFVRYGIESYFEIDPARCDEILQEVKALQEKTDKEMDDEANWKANTDYKFCDWCYYGKTGVCGEGAAAAEARRQQKA